MVISKAEAADLEALSADSRQDNRSSPAGIRAMKLRAFIQILVRHGFELGRQSGTSHRVYKKRIGGKTRLVVVARHSENDDIKPGILDTMIWQSGLLKRTFRG